MVTANPLLPPPSDEERERDEVVVDLQPGQRLRVESAAYVDPAQIDIGEAGHVTTNVTSYDVITRRDGRLGLEVFLGTLHDHGQPLLVDAAPNADGAWELVAGGFDLEPRGMLAGATLLRIVYPTSVPWSGSLPFSSERRIVLLGAESKELVESWDPGATQVDEETAHCPATRVACRFVRRFRGRTLVVVDMPVTVNGALTYIPLGTTLRNVVEPFVDWRAERPLAGVRLTRDVGGRRMSVRLDAASTTSPVPLEVGLVPLLPRDAVSVPTGRP